MAELQVSRMDKFEMVLNRALSPYKVFQIFCSCRNVYIVSPSYVEVFASIAKLFTRRKYMCQDIHRQCPNYVFAARLIFLAYQFFQVFNLRADNLEGTDLQEYHFPKREDEAGQTSGNSIWSIVKIKRYQGS